MKCKNVGKLLVKTEYVLLIRNLKQALNQGFFLKKVHRVFNLIKMLG